jgi:hypothetical protein
LAQASEQKCCPPILIERDSSTLHLQSEQSHKSRASVITKLSATTHSVYDFQGIISWVVNRTLKTALQCMAINQWAALFRHVNTMVKSVGHDGQQDRRRPEGR